MKNYLEKYHYLSPPGGGFLIGHNPWPAVVESALSIIGIMYNSSTESN